MSDWLQQTKKQVLPESGSHLVLISRIPGQFSASNDVVCASASIWACGCSGTVILDQRPQFPLLSMDFGIAAGIEGQLQQATARRNGLMHLQLRIRLIFEGSGVVVAWCKATRKGDQKAEGERKRHRWKEGRAYACVPAIWPVAEWPVT